MRKIEVMGSGYARPQHRIDNQDLETILDTSDEWIVQRTGIHSRYVSTEETTSMLAARAAQAALDNAGVDKEAIALLIVATLSGDQPMPSTACLVQEQLGMMDQDIMAFDLNAACSGFLFALQCASAMLEDGQCALIIGAENLSKVIDWTDRGTSILFGDGAGAMIIRKGAQGKESWHFARSKGDPNRVLDIPGKTLSDVPCRNVAEHYRYLSMDGREVFRFAVGAMQEAIEEVLKRAGKTIDEADLIIPHQANIRILAGTVRRENMLLNQMFESKYPVIQGAMANIATAEFAASVSNAGGMGVIGTGAMNVEQAREAIRKCRSLTDKPFGVNVMMMNPYTKELMEMIAEEKVALVTTGAGNPGVYMKMLKESGARVFPVVPSVAMAIRMERSGADGLIVEGGEAGGHVGEQTTMALLPQVVDAVSIPVVAAGGIADSRGFAAALCLGAIGVQVGTCLLVSEECPIHENYKNAVIKAKDTDTVVTGRSLNSPVRILKNPMSRQYIKLEAEAASRDELEKLTLGGLRRAVFEGDMKTGSVMMGQIAGLCKEIRPLKDILDSLVSDIPSVLAHAEQALEESR